jgi:hypothetical protein
MSKSGWIGVDLDGTLAHYDGWNGPDHIGKPIKPMVDRVKKWIADGQEVRIFTARLHGHGSPLIGGGTYDALTPIKKWCWDVFGTELEITNSKDYGLIELWDDRAIQVEMNTGRKISENQDDCK